MHADTVDRFIRQWNRQRPDLDAGPLAVVSRLLRLEKYLEQSADRALRPFGLNLWQFDVLAALRRSGPPFTLTPSELLRQVTLTSGALTNRIDRLEALGLVERRDDPNDRRGVQVRLTPRGLRIVNDAIAVRLEEAATHLAPFSPDERQTLADLLRRLLLTFERAEPLPPGDIRPARRSPPRLAAARASLPVRSPAVIRRARSSAKITARGGLRP